MNLFSGLWAKLVGLMGAAIAIMGVMLKLKNHKIENLEEENIMYQEKGRITEEMNEAKAKAKDKKDETIKKLDDISVSDKRRRI